MTLTNYPVSSMGFSVPRRPASVVRHAHVVDVARKNPALSIPVTVGRAAAAQKDADLPRPVVANCRWVHAMQDVQTETIKPRSSDDPVLREIVRRLVGAYNPERIYLFGSTARGDAGPDSDYDLMVVLPDEAPQRLRRGNPGYRALRGTGVAADVQVWPRGDFDRQLHLKASFPSTIVREGKLLYGA